MISGKPVKALEAEGKAAKGGKIADSIGKITSFNYVPASTKTGDAVLLVNAEE